MRACGTANLTLVQQPKGSRLCGQACLATLAGRTLEEAVEAVGHRRGTRTVELARVLRLWGFRCRDRLTSFGGRGVPGGFRGIAKLRRGSGSWHWIVISDGLVLDPDEGEPVELERYLVGLTGFWVERRVTSGLWVAQVREG